MIQPSNKTNVEVNECANDYTYPCKMSRQTYKWIIKWN